MTATAAPPRRPRTALWVAVGLGVVLLLLVVVLATREAASSRLARSPLVGKAVPALAGDGFDIDDRQGEWVVVNFFATWCQPCIDEHDDLVRFSESRDDASVVSVVFSDDADDVERFFAARGGDWPIVHDDDGGIATSFGVARVPESYLVAPDGTVVAKVTGGVTDDFLAEQIERLS